MLVAVSELRENIGSVLLLALQEPCRRVQVYVEEPYVEEPYMYNDFFNYYLQYEQSL